MRIGPVSQALTPNFSWCYRCKTTWAFVKGHSTSYEPNSGCFPLCERCWVELKTPPMRLPYYRTLWDDWQQWRDGENDELYDLAVWDRIETAVLNGG